MVGGGGGEEGARGRGAVARGVSSLDKRERV